MAGDPSRPWPRRVDLVSFEGKGVVVTGAAQGIGRAVAKAFAAEGAGVVMLDNEGDVLEATAQAIHTSGARAEAIVGDVSRREDVRQAVELAIERFGHLDAAVQVAGIADFVPFLEFTDESWDRILDVNLRGTWYLVQEAGRAMVRGGSHGAIVVTSSTNAFQPEAGGLGYNTSKSGQVAVMHTAALELSRHGIRVNAIAPGIINTRLSWFVINNPEQARVFLDRIPLGRFAEPEEMAKPILWMCSDDASYLSGHLMVVDGAMTAGLPEPGEMDTPLPGAIR
ncbi:MAG: SDR family oxidoreductase [Chloroflexi bacterium]|nr:MAG: SDR family oxidoreductase [Chloroflexota bacterium]TMF36858.1 MAG: SDR family oxidoreductase [Chloroflexota bacterium]